MLIMTFKSLFVCLFFLYFGKFFFFQKWSHNFYKIFYIKRKRQDQRTCTELICRTFKKKTTKYKEIKNCETRRVTLTYSHNNISPVLRILHWFPVKYRVMYKILLLTHKCLDGLAAGYMTFLFQEYKPSHNLRSSSKLNLVPSSSVIIQVLLGKDLLLYILWTLQYLNIC